MASVRPVEHWPLSMMLKWRGWRQQQQQQQQ